MKKYRVWWIPQVGCEGTFTVEVKTPLEGVKLLTVLGAYDKFQLDKNIKGDYSNCGGLEEWEKFLEKLEEVHDYLDMDFYDTVDDALEELNDVKESLSAIISDFS